MLPKKDRINKKLFDEIFKNGKTYHSDSLYVKISKLQPEEESKFAFVTPAKFFKKAYERNKLRRQGYSVIKYNLKDIKKGFAIIFFLKKEIKDINFEKYKTEVENILNKVKILNNIKLN